MTGSQEDTANQTARLAKRNGANALTSGQVPGAELLAQALGSTSQMVGIMDCSSRLTYANESLLTKFGLNANEALGQEGLGLLHPGLSTESKRLILGQAGVGGWKGDLIGRNSDGTEFPVSATLSPVQLKGGTDLDYVLIEEDITERRRLEQEVLDISDRERQAVSRDLHDGLCQDLMAISLKSARLAKRLADGAGESSEEVKTINSLLTHAVKSARNMARGLRPIGDDSLGLCEALNELAEHARRLHSTEIVVDIPDEIPVHSQAVSEQLYRIAQEAMNNACKHAKAKKVSITLKRMNSFLLLMLKDDGVGLSNQENSEGGMGLDIMKYRANSINADLHFNSVRGKGTVVSCAVSMEKANSKEGNITDGQNILG